MSPTEDRTGLHRADRVAILAIAAVAAFVALVGLTAGVAAALVTALSPTVGAELLATNPLELDDPHVLESTSTSAYVLVDDASFWARAALSAGSAIGALTTAIIAGAVAWMLFRVARGTPFHASFFRLGIVAACALVFGGMLGGAAHGFGLMQLAADLDDVTPGVFTVGFEFDPAPVAIGFVVLALAFVFRAGTRLQRETAGLV